MRRKCMCIVFFLSLCFSGNLAALPSAAVSDHLIPLPAVNFASSSPQTASVRLSQREYERETKSLKELCDIKYQKLLRSLNKEEKELLSASQSKWNIFLLSLQKTLTPQLDTPVKVFYGVKGKERITNICRDAVIASYKQRISDLHRWTKGNFTPLKTTDTEKSLLLEKRRFNERASRNIYLMEERYRREEFASQKAWRDFREAQLSFIKKMTEDRHSVSEEDLLMLRRINNLRVLQAEGLVFFKQEREE